MGITKILCRKRFVIYGTKILCCIVLLSAQANAEEWNLEPTVKVEANYSDNISLSPNRSAKDEHVIGISPGVTLNGGSNLTRVNLGYTLQNLFYLKNTSRDSRFHQLNSGFGLTVVPEHFNIASSATISQKSFSGESNDNINRGDRGDVVTLGVNPQFRHRTGGGLATAIDYQYSTVKYDGNIADSTLKAYDGNIGNQDANDRLRWNASVSKQIVNRDELETIEQETGRFSVRFDIFGTVDLLFESGYEKDKIVLADPVEDGNYTAAGLGWKPNRHFTFEGLYGEEQKSANMNLRLSQRTGLQLNWQNRNFGINPGSSWNGQVNMKNRRLEVSGSFREETTTVQQIESDESISGSDSLGLTNEIFIRKVSSITTRYSTRKSGMTFKYLTESREFQESLERVDVRNFSLSAFIRPTARSRVESAYLREKRNSVDNILLNNKYNSISVKYTLNIKNETNISLLYRNSSRNYDDGDRNYRENRIRAALLHRF